MLKAHTSFQICQNNTALLQKLNTITLTFLLIGHIAKNGKNTCKACKPEFMRTLDLLLPTSIFCATRTFARLEIICTSWIYE